MEDIEGERAHSQDVGHFFQKLADGLCMDIISPAIQAIPIPQPLQLDSGLEVPPGVLPLQILTSPSELGILSLSQKFHWTQDETRELIKLMKSPNFTIDDVAPDPFRKLDRISQKYEGFYEVFTYKKFHEYFFFQEKHFIS
jgi:hypothetical protein